MLLLLSNLFAGTCVVVNLLLLLLLLCCGCMGKKLDAIQLLVVAFSLTTKCVCARLLHVHRTNVLGLDARSNMGDDDDDDDELLWPVCLARLSQAMCARVCVCVRTRLLRRSLARLANSLGDGRARIERPTGNDSACGPPSDLLAIGARVRAC